MDHNTSQSNIPISKSSKSLINRLKQRPFQANSSFNYSNNFSSDQLDESTKFNSWKSNTDHFNTEKLDDNTKFINWNLSYLNDAKKCLNSSLYYLKNEAKQRSWFRSKRIWSIIAIVSLIIISYNYCSNLYTGKYTELENEIKSIKQIITDNELDKKLNNELNNELNKELKNELNNELEYNKFNPIKIDYPLKSTNFESNLDEMINNKIDKIIIMNIEYKIKELIDNELDFKLTHLIDSKLDEQLIDEFKNQINQHLNKELTRQLNEKLNENLNRQLELQINEKLNNSTSLSTDRKFINNSIRTIINDLILNNKESKPDYASELNNAFIIDSSPTYINYSESIVFFSIPLWSTSGSPNSIIKRNSNLFEYHTKPWKMQSNKGFIKIKLAKSIIPESFTYEHIIRNSILDENQITCSPKIFNVIGYENENSIESISLGRFNFKLTEDVKIYEPKFIFDKIESKISIIQFNIEDNYGNSNYTCMHRLKVF